VILIDEQAILVEHRRAGTAVIVREAADLAVPDDPAVEIDRQQAVAAKRRVDAASVGRRRGRRVAVLRVAELDAALRHEGFEELLAVGAAEPEDREALAAVVGGGQEDAIAPDNRRRVAAPRDRRAPGDIFLCRPPVRIRTVGHEALSRWPSPARPVRRRDAFRLDHANRIRRPLRSGASREHENQRCHHAKRPNHGVRLNDFRLSTFDFRLKTFD